MNKTVKEKWLSALRSGEYTQGRGALHQTDSDGDKFCCLGVLCDVAVKEGLTLDVETSGDYVLYDGNPSILPLSVSSWAGLDFDNPNVILTRDYEVWCSATGDLVKTVQAGQKYEVAPLNDSGYTFAEIADLIEASL